MIPCPRLWGTGFLAKRALGGTRSFTKDPDQFSMPVVTDPPLTTRQVVRVASELLPAFGSTAALLALSAGLVQGRPSPAEGEA